MVHLRSVRVMTMYFPFALVSLSAASATEVELVEAVVLWASLCESGADLEAIMARRMKSGSKLLGIAYAGDLIVRRRSWR